MPHSSGRNHVRSLPRFQSLHCLLNLQTIQNSLSNETNSASSSIGHLALVALASSRFVSNTTVFLTVASRFSSLDELVGLVLVERRLCFVCLDCLSTIRIATRREGCCDVGRCLRIVNRATFEWFLLHNNFILFAISTSVLIH